MNRHLARYERRPGAGPSLPVTVLLLLMVGGAAAASQADRWSPRERAELAELWIGSLGPTPEDRTNRVADSPAAADLGHRLFFDPRLSANGQVSCGSCHLPESDFQDGVALAKGVGTTDRRTMPIQGTAHAPFLFWDGRKDSQWAQALGPLESPVEHGGSRALYAHVIADYYRSEYEAVFGPLPELMGVPRSAGPVEDPLARTGWEALTEAQRTSVTSIFVNIGKAIAAYERTLEYAPSRFDRYVEGLIHTGQAPAGILTPEEVAGLRIFIGKGNCTQCHNGPLFSNQDFHNTGVPAPRNLPPDLGRLRGAQAVLTDEFNCRSAWSDGDPERCEELAYLTVGAPEQERAFKTPSLRNVAERAPYMHAGQFESLAEVLEHYNRAPRAPSGHTELERLRLTRGELRQLEAFLRSLSGGTVAPSGFLTAPATLKPTGVQP